MALDQILIKYGLELDEVKRELADLKKSLLGVETAASKSSKKAETGFKAADKAIDETNRSARDLGVTLNKTAAQFEAVSKKGQHMRLEMKEIVSKGINPMQSTLSTLRNQILATFGVGVLIAFSKEAVNTTAKMQGLSTQLNFITGSNEKGAESFAKVRLLVDRLGLELVSTTEAYTKFAGAATKSGMTMSAVDAIFENVAIATKAMNLSAEDTSGVFLAMQQMISKGNVAAEELRGQMSERLPGAFSLAAKSIGVTERELNKMLEQGQVISKEFLPAFSEQLRTTFEDAMGDATTSLTSNLNRMSNAWTEFKLTVGVALAPVVEGMAHTAIQLQNLFGDDSVETMQENIEATQEWIDMYAEFGDTIRSTADSIVKDFHKKLKEENPKTAAEVKKLADEFKSFYADNVKGAADFQQEAVKLASEGIDRIVTSQKDLGKVTPLTTAELAKQEAAVKALAKFMKENGEAVDEFVKKQQDLLSLFVSFEIVEKVDADMQKLNDQFSRMQSEKSIDLIGIDTENYAEAMAHAEENAVRLKPALEGVNEVIKETAENELPTGIEAWTAYGNAVMEVIGSLTDYYQQQSDYRLELLNNELEAGKISQGQYDKDAAELRRKEAIRSKVLGIFDVVINTPGAIMKAFAQLGPAGAVLAAAAGVLQLGAILNTPIPKFKKGVIGFKGKGTDTSDENLALISNNESIITAKGTRKHKALLEAVNKDKVDEYFASFYLNKAHDKKASRASDDQDYREYLELKRLGLINRNGFAEVVKALKDNKPHRY